jgi:hypothetical protein
VTAKTSGSSDPSGGIVSRTIDFGDGATSTAVTASHTYNTAGTFTVTLSVTDYVDPTATTSQAVMANPPLLWTSGLSTAGARPEQSRRARPASFSGRQSPARCRLNQHHSGSLASGRKQARRIVVQNFAL